MVPEVVCVLLVQGARHVLATEPVVHQVDEVLALLAQSHQQVRGLNRQMFIINVWWRHATLFDILCTFSVHYRDRNRRNTGSLLMHGCCRLEATGSRIEAGLQVECCGFIWVLRSKSNYAPHIRGSYGPVSECPPA